MTLPRGQIGSLDVGPIGFGAMGLSSTYGQSDDNASIETLHHAFECGVRMVDTSCNYGQGHNEELVGKAIADRRDRVVVATKFGFVPADQRNGRSIDNSPPFIRQQLEGSLRRLNTDYIDLYYVHRVAPDTPIEETIATLAALRREGLIREFGLCEIGDDILRRAHAVHPVAALQSEYSLWTREAEAAVIPAASELGVAFVAYSPLGRGFLAGNRALAPDDRRREHPRFQADAIAANEKRYATLAEIAEAKKLTTGQVCLAWCLSKSVIPIPGTRTIAHLDQNLDALHLHLDEAEIQRLEASFTVGSTVGERYPKGSVAYVK